MATTRLPVNRNHGTQRDLEYQDGAGGFKILLAEYIACVIQYYSDQCQMYISITDLNSPFR